MLAIIVIWVESGKESLWSRERWGGALMQFWPPIFVMFSGQTKSCLWARRHRNVGLNDFIDYSIITGNALTALPSLTALSIANGSLSQHAVGSLVHMTQLRGLTVLNSSVGYLLTNVTAMTQLTYVRRRMSRNSVHLMLASICFVRVTQRLPCARVAPGACTCSTTRC